MNEQTNLGLDIKSTPLVFVYGTLKEGGSNSHLMKGAKRVGSGIVYGYGTLLNTYPPTFSKEASQHPFRGELYSIDEAILTKLDMLEGHPVGYYRTQVDVFVSEDQSVRAWCYFYYTDFGGEAAPVEAHPYCDKAHVWKE